MRPDELRRAVRHKLCEWNNSVEYTWEVAHEKSKQPSTDALKALLGYGHLEYWQFQDEHGGFSINNHTLHNTLLALCVGPTVMLCTGP